VNRLLRLTLLAPDIQEAILEGSRLKGMAGEPVAGDAGRMARAEARHIP
jgi:hypothetical protein